MKTKLATDKQVKARIVESGALTEQELIEIETAALLTSALIEARKDKKLTQKELEAITGIKQQVIARLESGNVNPKVSTISKLLRPLGKKLAIVDA
jgi:ribosome-binding protein aMBF1 (putative translation factor)